ncbi:MAG TPA: HD domain-containing phosphohydrolase [Candidatus Baltobacteraceae bacterium]|nr:HD domain-containing phosphohydrolase [Candidatus Baltobacteraceae bacterium]
MKDQLVGPRPDGTSDRLLMQRAASLLSTDLSLGELFERLTTLLPEYLDSAVVFIALTHQNGQHAIEYIYDHGEIRRYPHIPLTERSRARAVLETSQIIWGNRREIWAPEGTYPINPDRPWTNDTHSAIFVPMRVGGTVVGCLSVQSVHEGAYTGDDVETVAAIGHFLGVAVQNQRMYQALQRTAEYDPQTGLANHSRICRQLDQALAVASSTQPIVAIMLDVINFAQFNELYGYAEGDDVLRRIAAVLREFEDADDTIAVGRFGGDIFMMILRDGASDLASHAVGRVMARLSDLAYVSDDQTLPITIACGYAVAPLDAGSRAEILALCEQRTRHSRKLGGAAVCSEDSGSHAVYGAFEGIEPIVESLLNRDPFTRVHLLQVNAMAKSWSEHNLDLDHASLVTLLQASLMHDVGKLLVADRMLSKPGPLSKVEYEAVMLHAEYGRHVLMQHPGYAEVAEIVGQHHERWDGTGYPAGLAGEQIHPLARAISILDAFSAMVADRPYHRGITEDAALAELQRCAGTQFDPDLVDRFVAWREEGNPAPLG